MRPEELPERVADIVEPAAGRREGARAGPRRQQVLAAAAALAGRRRATSYGVGVRRPRRRTAPAPTTCARWPSTSAAGCARRPARRRRGRSASRNGRPAVVVATNDAARARGVTAGDLVAVGAGVLGGGGGGKDDVAQGGGTDAGHGRRGAAARRARGRRSA